MSCITKLLEQKGDAPFLLCENGVALEGGGIFNGYEWCVVLNYSGFRCGYVAIPPGHPFNGINYSDKLTSCLEVHGGLTFSGKSHLIESDCDDWWFGFDAGHLHDGIDKEKLMEYYPSTNLELRKEMLSLFDGSVKDFDYMQHQCESLITQIS